MTAIDEALEGVGAFALAAAEFGVIVKHGPPAWTGHSGTFVREGDDGRVLVQLSSRDDAGDSIYDVWMPKEMLEVPTKGKA